MFIIYNAENKAVDMFGIGEYLMGRFKWVDLEQHKKCLNYFLKYLASNKSKYNISATLGWGLSTLYDPKAVKLVEQNALQFNQLLTEITNYKDKFRLCLQYQENIFRSFI